MKIEERVRLFSLAPSLFIPVKSEVAFSGIYLSPQSDNGGEGAFCDDPGVLVIDEVSDEAYIPVRPAWCPLVPSYIVRLFLQAKKWHTLFCCPIFHKGR
jgi:hypothetical protein